MNIESTYHRYLKLTGEASAAASLVLAEAMAGSQPARRDEYMTVAQAAERYNLGKSTLYDACEAGKLKHSRAGKAIRLRPADLEQYLEGQESLFG